MAPIRTPPPITPTVNNNINTRSTTRNVKESDSCAVLNDMFDTLKNVLLELNKQSEQLKRHEKLLNEIKVCVDSDKDVHSGLSEQIKKIIENDGSTKETYANKIKQKEPPIVIAPKSIGQKSEVTKKAVKDIIDPVQSGISGIRNAAKGAIILECKNKESSSKLKDEVIQKLGKNYNVNIPELKNPRFKICSMTEKLNEETIIENIKQQNDFVSPTATFKIIKLLEAKKAHYTEYMAIVETDPNSFESIIANEKINIGWDRCKVFKHIYISRCYKCLGFSHSASDCNKQQACINCGGEHLIKDCTKIEPNCVNCSWAVKNLNMKLDVNHRSLSNICPVLLKKKEREQNKINVPQ